MDSSYRQYSTIGIEGFVCGPPDHNPLPSQYLVLSSSSSSSSSSDEPLSHVHVPPPTSSSFTSWEMIGRVKETPQDFVVREILPKDDRKMSNFLSHYRTSTSTITSTITNDTSSTSTSTSMGDGEKHGVVKTDINTDTDHQNQLRIATMTSRSAITLPSNLNSNKTKFKELKNNVNATGECDTETTDAHGQLRKKTIVGEKIPSLAIPIPSTSGVSVLAAPESESLSGGNTSVSPAPAPEPEPTAEEIIRLYINKVATSERPETLLLQSIEELNEKATNRIPTSKINNKNDEHEHEQEVSLHEPKIRTDDNIDNSSLGNENTEVWIPPLYLSVTDVKQDSHINTQDDVCVETDPADDEKAITAAEMKAQRKAFYRAIRFTYPFLKTESATYYQSNSNHDDDDNGTSNTTMCTTSISKTHTPNTKILNNEGESHHWIKITIDDCFDGLIEYLSNPHDDLQQLFLFRNRGVEGASPEPALKSTTRINTTTQPTSSSSFVILRLRPGVSKDDRRKVHHILALKNKNFDSSIRHHQQQGSKKKKKQDPRSITISIPKEEKVAHCKNNASNILSTTTTDIDTTDLVVTWKKHALQKMMSNKNKKRKRGENNGTTSRDDNSSYNNDTTTNLLCILKKTQKEHLTTIQILSRSLRCRQSDIGFAGIKDMQAITYQFITLRNMEQHRVERVIERQFTNRSNIEVKILCSNVDFVLTIGDLEGNQFEITVRNLQRVKVDPVILPSNGSGSGILEPAKESFVDCDSAHIDRMVERIKQHGFLNFYGEQRIGAPGTRKEVGVRAFEIGRAMLRQDFRGAIHLLMEGTRHHETEDNRRVRQAWKDSDGDPSKTLKAFRGADIMPRERAILRGLKRYPDDPLEAIRFLSYNMRIFYINSYQSYIFNRVVSQRVRLYGGGSVVKGDLYFDNDGEHRDKVKVVEGNEDPPIAISQVVLPLPGYDVQYPTHEIGQCYRDLLDKDRVQFVKKALPEATAKGNYRKLIVFPKNLTAEMMTETESSSVSTPGCNSMKLAFQLPKGCYATMLLRELMLTTVVRSTK